MEDETLQIWKNTRNQHANKLLAQRDKREAPWYNSCTFSGTFSGIFCLFGSQGLKQRGKEQGSMMIQLTLGKKLITMPAIIHISVVFKVNMVCSVCEQGISFAGNLMLSWGFFAAALEEASGVNGTELCNCTLQLWSCAHWLGKKIL